MALLLTPLLIAATAACALAADSFKARPNIHLFLTDDQDVELNKQLDSPLGPMRYTKQLLQDAGATGTHAYVNVPICCPSRANILVGRFAHNIRDDHYEPFPNHTTDSSGAKGKPQCGDEPVEALSGKPLPCGCMRMNCSSFGEFESKTYADYLQRAGYATAYFGKYLNPPAMVKYCRNMTLGPLEGGWPAGWDVFYGMCDQASTPEGGYYDMNWVDSAAGAITHTGVAPEDYTTSVIGNKTVDWIKANAGKLAAAGKPFMSVSAVRAPHAPYLPPPWYLQTFEGIRAPRNGAYNATPVGKVRKMPSWPRSWANCRLPFIAVFPQECMGQLASFRPT
jgi:arylsulfatase A-like enzyme